MKNTQIYRHGDVGSIVPIEKIPEGLKKLETNGSFVLAYGEVTGHKHVITAPDLRVYQDAEGRHYFKIDSAAKLTHEEHKTITVMPGIYRVNHEQEKDWFSLKTRRVID